MKHLLFFAFTFLFFACGEEAQPELPGSLPLVPDTFTQADFTKVFIHNTAGQLSEVKMISALPGGGTMNSSHLFSYHSTGQLAESTTDTGWRYVHFFSGDKIIRTDEFVNGALSQYHTFSYNSK